LKRQGVIASWHDRRIGAGTEWAGQIDDHLNSAKVILLLVSSDFLASDYCYDLEMKRAMERHDAKEACVIPIALRPCDWKGAPFGKLQGLPKDMKPVTSWANQDEAFTDIARGIRQAVEKIKANPEHLQRKTAAKTAGKSQASQLPPIWNLSHARNPNFTGREEILSELRRSLNEEHATALTQGQAIHGLGGVGKTELAIEYAYRYCGDYQIVWWLRSEEPSTLAADYASLAMKLDLPEKEAQEQSVIIAAVKERLRVSSRWLLIFDNATDSKSVRDYIPQGSAGHILVTSRNANWRGLMKSLTVQKMKADDAIAFLLKRTGQTDETSARELAKELDYLPLALEQAAAFIDASSCTISHYVTLFRTRQQEMLKRGEVSTDYPATVSTTWEMAFQQVEQKSPAAAALMKLCAFFAPDDISLEMITAGAKYLPEPLQTAATDTLALDEAVEALLTYSLVERKNESLFLHRLVQAVTRHRMSEEEFKSWAEAAISVVNKTFPSDSDDVRTWPIVLPLLPHATMVSEYAEIIKSVSGYASRLLNQMGLYFRVRADYIQAKSFHQRGLAIGEENLGKNHPSVAIPLNNLGLVLQDLGDLESAKAHYERALEIFREFLGDEHPSTKTVRSNLEFLNQKMK
jgi:tetratricopeptide (TPR) repeat protein